MTSTDLIDFRTPELAEMLADSDLLDGTAARHGHTRTDRIRIRNGSTRTFLVRTIARRFGGQAMPVPFVG